jgi:hypothetical protein
VTREELAAPLNLPEEALEGWDMVPLLIEGKHAGTLIVRGMEVHFAVTERPTACVRGPVRKMLEPVFDRYGMLTTKVPKGLGRAKRFVQRLGFKPTWRDQNFQYYLLPALPWGRPKKEI